MFVDTVGPLEVVLSGGTVVDGRGGPLVRADVGIAGGSIVALGDLRHSPTAEVVDVSGRYVMPGMVDVHVHVDGAAFDPQLQLAALRQGVTSWIVGQDGLSFAPSSSRSLAWLDHYFGAINGPAPAIARAGCTVAEYLSAFEHATALNVGFLVPAGNVRLTIMGTMLDPPSKVEVRRMRSLVENGLSEGALGLSTGLEYIPGRFADTDELAAIAAPLGGDGVYVSHIRSYGDELEASIVEAIDICDRAGVRRAHISHLQGPSEHIRRALDTGPDRAVETRFDLQPYLRGNTLLAMLLLPSWLCEKGVDHAVEQLCDPHVVDSLRRKWFPTVSSKFERITLANVEAERWRWSEGMTLADAAHHAEMDIGSFVCRVVAESRLRVGAVVVKPQSSDRDIRVLIKDPRFMGGSDGVPFGGQPHPRFWGTFARFLGRHVRDLADLSWAQAAHQLASEPMRWFGLARRGQIQPGYVADISVVDPAQVADRASYDNPRRLSVGVDDVMVAGIWVLRRGELTGRRPGTVLRR